MSEYQLYEFQALDRVLTPADREYLERLSSRLRLTATSALFNYSYGDFRGEPLEVLERCFDIMLYRANFGCVQLAIRLPKAIATPQLYEPYCTSDGISIEQTPESVIVNISLAYEDYSGVWVSEEGDLAGLVPLRAALMKGDLRMLYLAWLATGFSVDSLDWEDKLEPSIPPNLKQRSPELTCLADVFQISDNLIEVAASASESTSGEFTEPIKEWILALTENERNHYLLRVAQGESNVGVELMRQLRQQFGKPIEATGAKGHRTFADLARIAAEKAEKQQHAKRRLAEEAEQARIESLGGPKVELQWLVVGELVQAGKAENYNKAIGHLKNLRAVALKSDKLEAFNARLQELKQTASRKKSFISKLSEAGF